MTVDLDKVGRLVRDHTGADRSSTEHLRHRERLVATACRTSRPRSVRWFALPAAAVAVVLAVLAAVGLFKTSSDAELAFVVGPDAQAGAVGSYYAATVEPVLLEFSDGTRVNVEPGGGARVARIATSEPEVLIEGGRIEVAVARSAGRKWQFAAGPYTIAVTGTRFLVEWDASTGSLELQMHEGSVIVYGPGVESGAAVSGTERFVTHARVAVEGAGPSPRAARAEPKEAESEMPVRAEPAVPDDVNEGAQAAVSAPPVRPSSRGPKPQVRAAAPSSRAAAKAEPGPSWPALVARGAYADVVAEAKHQGIGRALGNSSAAELTALADSARFSGNPGLARRALLEVRQRFPGGGQAASAAFVLGRLSDAAGDPSGALSWYDRYLVEGGPLEGEALGRKLAVLVKMGARTKARQAAKAYLKRFPKGPYADLARETAGR